MIVLSLDPDDVPGMTVFDPFFRIVPADGDNTPYTKGITEDLYGFGDSLADTDTMAQRPDDLVGIWLFQFVVADIFADEIVELILKIGGTPYAWIMSSELPALNFADFNSVILTILGVCANGAVALIALILVLILAWNYIKLLFEAAERYVLLGVLVFTAPVAFATGAAQATSNIFKAWCRMFGGQIFLLLMNAWCLRLFITMVGTFLANPLSL